MSRADVPAELHRIAVTAMAANEKLPEDQRDQTPHHILAAVLPAAHDMWRTAAINDAARILIHTNGDGITITCPPCDEVLYTGFGSVGASAVLAALLGHLTGDQHTGRRP